MNSEVKHSLKQVLHLSAGQWAWVLSAYARSPTSPNSPRLTGRRYRFYYPYAVAEPICTFFVKATSPSIWLGRIFVSWGIVMACMAAVTVRLALLASLDLELTTSPLLCRTTEASSLAVLVSLPPRFHLDDADSLPCSARLA